MQARVLSLAALFLLLSSVTRAEAPGGAYSPEKALALYHQGKYAEDEALCKAAIGDIEKADGDKSPKLARPLDDLATIYLRVGRLDEAKPVIERAEGVLDKSTPEGAAEYAHLCINKGWRFYSLGDVDKAEQIFIEGRDLLEKFHKTNTVDYAELLNNIGLAYADNESEDAGKVKEGKVLLFKGWELRKKLTGNASPETEESLNNLGMHLLFHPEGENDIGTALTTLQKATALSEEVYGKDNPETAMAYTNLAAAYHITQQDELAEAEIHKAMPITEKFMGKESGDYAYELQILGQILQTQGKYKEAEEDYQRALEITKKTYGPTNTAVASALDYLASLYEAMGNQKKQAEVEKQVTKIRGRDI